MDLGQSIQGGTDVTELGMVQEDEGGTGRVGAWQGRSGED